jgi:Holliday junction resolvasome RuvABC endonuclease subunit
VRVVGLDSAAATGFAIIEETGAGRRLLHSGVLPATSWDEVARAVDELAAWRPDVVVVEAPYVARNAHTGLQLAELLGRWLQSWEQRGIATITCQANKCQLAVLPGIHFRSDRAARKVAALALAKALFGVDLPEDEADAVGLALWGLDQARQQAA